MLRHDSITLFRLQQFSGALVDDGKKLLARYASDGTQSQESEKEKWRDERRKKGHGERGGAKEGKEETKKERRQQKVEFLEMVQGGEQACERGENGERRNWRQKKKEKVELVKDGEWMFLLFLVTHNFGVADAASEDLRKREEQVEDGKWKKEIARNGWFEKEDDERFPKLRRTKSRSEIRKPANTVSCTLLNGSARSAKKKYMMRYIELSTGWRFLFPGPRVDNRRLKMVADGLPLFHGAQLVVVTTLLSTVRSDGAPRRQCVERDEAALEPALCTKERPCPELTGEPGRWSEEANSFRTQMVRAVVYCSGVLRRSGVCVVIDGAPWRSGCRR